MEQGSPGRSAGAQSSQRIARRGAARQYLRAQPLLSRGRDDANARSRPRVRLQDPLVPPRRGGVQDCRCPGARGHRVIDLVGLVGLQGRGNGRDLRERRAAAAGRSARRDPLRRCVRDPAVESGSGESDVSRPARGDSNYPRPGGTVVHRESGVGTRPRLARWHARGREDGRRRGLVGRSVVGVCPCYSGLQRRLAGLRSQRSRTSAEHRFLAGAAMIAVLLAQTIAITGGTVYPVSGPKIENATVLIRDGKIAAVGSNVTVPAGATRIDAAGKWVTPGLIDGAGQMGLREISAVQNTNEATLRGNEVAASFNVLEGINPASTLIAVNRMEGVTTTLAVPNGSLIWGQAVLIDLDGTTIEAMRVKSPTAMVADRSEGENDAGGGARCGVAQRLGRGANDAR